MEGNNSQGGIKGLTKCAFCTIFAEVVDLKANSPVSLSGFPAEVDRPFLCRQANVGRRHCETFGERNQTK